MTIVLYRYLYHFNHQGAQNMPIDGVQDMKTSAFKSIAIRQLIDRLLFTGQKNI